MPVRLAYTVDAVQSVQTHEGRTSSVGRRCRVYIGDFLARCALCLVHYVMHSGEVARHRRHSLPASPLLRQCLCNVPFILGWAFPTQIGISPPGLAMDAFPAMRRSPRSRTPAPCHRDDGAFVVVMCTVVTKCTMHLKRKVVAYYERCNAIMGPAHRNCLHRFRQSNTCPPVPARL